VVSTKYRSRQEDVVVLCAVDSARSVLLRLSGYLQGNCFQLLDSTDVGRDSRTESQLGTDFHSRFLGTSSLYPSRHQRCNRTGARFIYSPYKTSFRCLPSFRAGKLYLQTRVV